MLWIDAIHHTPKKRYCYDCREKLDIDSWQFDKIENQELYASFLKFIELSDNYRDMMNPPRIKVGP